MTTTSTNGIHSPTGTQAGLIPTIQRFQMLDRERKAAEALGRKIKKQADTLEAALTDQVEQAGGCLEAGTYILGFEFTDGSAYPPYRKICEEIIAEHNLPAGTLAEKLAALPKRRKLVIA